VSRSASAKAPHPRPGITPDSAFFWDGLARRELRIQRCAGCRRLRHPPGPMCPKCHSLDWDFVVAGGRGTIHSYVIAEHPPVPPFDYPNVIVLVDLEEGTRLVSRLADLAPDEVAIGLPVHVDFETVDGDLALHLFRPETDRSR